MGFWNGTRIMSHSLTRLFPDGDCSHQPKCYSTFITKQGLITQLWWLVSPAVSIKPVLSYTKILQYYCRLYESVFAPCHTVSQTMHMLGVGSPDPLIKIPSPTYISVSSTLCIDKANPMVSMHFSVCYAMSCHALPIPTLPCLFSPASCFQDFWATHCGLNRILRSISVVFDNTQDSLWMALHIR